MKRKRHSAEEIVKKLREAAIEQEKGNEVGEVCRTLGISIATYHRWKTQYGGMGKEALKRLKELEVENGRLKKLVADQALDMSILKEVARGKW